MKFRLVVRGALPPGDKRGTIDAKHRIRRELHPQLQSFWRQHPMLKIRWQAEPGQRSLVDQYADKYARCGFRFLPLVPLGEEVAVALDLVILRREDPYKLFTDTGDLDNRVKTLLDGLRMPRQCSELGGASPAPDEDPFFVLMEDDQLIYKLNVNTDRLLVPPEQDEAHRDVVAIIKVRTKVVSGAPQMNIHSYG